GIEAECLKTVPTYRFRTYHSIDLSNRHFRMIVANFSNYLQEVTQFLLHPQMTIQPLMEGLFTDSNY
ncbi:hypothetical protein, partial [Leptospira santarosai]|uniref:hypothetical protein n=1 Tax=Leptospira santarosai TaxID=28183 RepID=UPI000A977B0E